MSPSPGPFQGPRGFFFFIRLIRARRETTATHYPNYFLDPRFDNESCSSRYGAGIRRGFCHGGRSCSAVAEPKVEGGDGEGSGGGVEKGIVRRGAAAGDEGLVDFVHDGIAGGDGQGGDSPGPMPAFASASKAAKEQKAKNKILGEVRAFANDMVNQIELVRVQVRKKPFHEERENRRGVLGGEGIGR